MFATCFSTAPTVTTSCAAIAAFDRPSAINPSTSRSRGESPASCPPVRRARGCAATPGSDPPPPINPRPPRPGGGGPAGPPAGRAGKERRDAPGIECRPAAADAPHGRDEIVDVHDPILEQVAEPAAAVREQLGRIRLL